MRYTASPSKTALSLINDCGSTGWFCKLAHLFSNTVFMSERRDATTSASEESAID